jgi:branched-chain amino acid transport system substrate-binding protein
MSRVLGIRAAKPRWSTLLVLGLACCITAFSATTWAAEPIKMGLVSIFSGRVAMLGETSFRGAQLAADEINAKGGVLGRKIEIIQRDSGAKIEEAVRLAREMVVKDKVDFLLDSSSSRESFAVKEVSRDLKVLTMIVASETTANTADPKIWTPYSVRTARIGIHDAVAAGSYAAQMSKKLGLKKWASLSPDYAYGRDSTETFFWALKLFNPDIEIVSQRWPKIFEPDYTAHITGLLRDKPDAVYSCLWGGDIVTFLEQANLYGLLSQTKFFGINVADYTVLTALKKVPEGVHSGTRYLKEAPPTDANRKFGDDYFKKYNELPTNWSQENYVGVHLLAQAIEKAGTTETEAVIKALKGLSTKVMWGSPPAGTVTVRARDHQLINYTIGWGSTIPQPPYMTDLVFTDWDEILKYEEMWLKEKGWLE